jgi:hypothetical protein
VHLAVRGRCPRSLSPSTGTRRRGANPREGRRPRGEPRLQPPWLVRQDRSPHRLGVRRCAQTFEGRKFPLLLFSHTGVSYLFGGRVRGFSGGRQQANQVPPDDDEAPTSDLDLSLRILPLRRADSALDCRRVSGRCGLVHGSFRWLVVTSRRSRLTRLAARPRDARPSSRKSFALRLYEEGPG